MNEKLHSENIIKYLINDLENDPSFLTLGRPTSFQSSETGMQTRRYLVQDRVPMFTALSS